MDNFANELLQKIFEYCLPTTTIESIPSRRIAPFVLTHVCSQWRAAAWGHPRLWTSLCLKPRGKHNPIEFAVGIRESNAVADITLNRFIYKAGHWLKLAGSLPFQLYIDFPVGTSYGPTALKLATILLQHVIGPHFHRFSYLHLATMPRIMQMPDPAFPSLRAVSVTRAYMQVFNHPWIDNGVLVDSPSLQRIHLDFNGLPYRSRPLSRIFKGKHITHLSINACLSSPAWLEALSLCPSLQHCAIAIAQEEREAHEQSWKGGIVTLRQLTHLAAHVRGREAEHQHLFTFLQCPSLQNLTVVQDCGDFGHLSPILLALSSSSPLYDPSQLDYLAIVNNGLDNPSNVTQRIINSLSPLIKVTTLEMGNIVDDYDMFAEELSRNPTFLPKLRQLQLGLGNRAVGARLSPLNMTWDVLHRMIKTRGVQAKSKGGHWNVTLQYNPQDKELTGTLMKRTGWDGKSGGADSHTRISESLSLLPFIIGPTMLYPSEWLP
ncbi:hypothetical protein FA15DRAFT_706850 [Coprinopsis marcescibilis]|uniref:Uncharacterized protein n=1 Tax=Coprinopsis marcescibilis TaxID=230819 RepID=A0A5C3KNP3_COPMA|nr:hypothetical protein FA15DRAFT_706850 [Coprinopsis marcescibilis]